MTTEHSAISDLAERLRAGTRSLHAEVERTGIMADLIGGRCCRHSYCVLLRNFYDIYLVLEAALVRQSPVLGWTAFPFAEVLRTDALANDLLTLHGAGWHADLPLAETARDYVQRLKMLEATKPVLLIAHGYVRHLGDLSGGQMLRMRIAQTLDLKGSQGTRFYDFPAVDIVGLIARYRQAINGLTVDESATAALVDEARYGFTLHRQLFNELQSLRAYLRSC